MASESERAAGHARQSPRQSVEERLPTPPPAPILIRPRTDAVPAETREGVFVHSFMCNECGLHFNLYSWQANRQRTDTVYCPECGQHAGRFRHWRGQLSELTGEQLHTRSGRQAMLNAPGEVYRHCPAPGAGLMADSSVEGLREVSHL